jgi:hypothetical protein
LKVDHRSVEKLFTAFEKAGDGAMRTKQHLVDDIYPTTVNTRQRPSKA